MMELVVVEGGDWLRSKKKEEKGNENEKREQGDNHKSESNDIRLLRRLY
jgi:hypothetical protein